MRAMTDDELKRMLEAQTAEIRRHFDEALGRASSENRDFFQMAAETIRHETQLIAEGVSGTREALDREAAGLREEIRLNVRPSSPAGGGRAAGC
jgi:hypothetical protein